MAPGYRNQNRRQNRTGYVDHDLFEGLPVRHWRRDYVTVAPPPSQEDTKSLNDIWAVELPHGMPKDFHLLPQHSQDLLRGARSGRIYKRPAPIEEDEVDTEGTVEKPEKKEEEAKDKGFSAKAWKQVPRHLEGPDLEYLAKRRKNIITIGSKAPKPVPTVVKATMKRIDAAGNEYVQDVIIPHGQQIEGEVISTTEIPDPSAISGGLPLQPTPTKRKPVPRKKLKGPGRGRKKKIIAPTSAPALEGVVEVAPPATVGTDGVKIESEGSVPPSQVGDIEMQEGSAPASDNDESDEGEDGEDGDDDESSVANEGSPSKPPKRDSPLPLPLPKIASVPTLTPEDTPMSGVEAITRPVLHLDDRVKSGSPLKNIALSTSTLASPLEGPKSGASAAPFAPVPEEQVSQEKITEEKVTEEKAIEERITEEKVIEEEIAEVKIPEEGISGEKIPKELPEEKVLEGKVQDDKTTEIQEIDKEMQREVAELAPEPIAEAPPSPTKEVVEAAVELRKAEEEEEEMLLHILEPTQAKEEIQEVTVAPVPAEEIPKEQTPVQPEETAKDTVKEAAVTEKEKEEDFPDLLGNLEKSLGNPAADS